MSNKPFIDDQLITPAINDERSRALVSIMGQELAEFDYADLVIQDPLTVDAKLLPEMIVARAMTDFVTPGLNENLLRNLLSNAYDIHALSGTMPGIRRALASLGVTAEWVQWFQEDPKAPHDTHKATIFFETSIADGYVAGDSFHRKAVIKLINASKRFSQEIAYTFGVRTKGAMRMGVTTRAGGVITHQRDVLNDQTERQETRIGILPRMGGYIRHKEMAA
jgi:phage tail P2-like protein